MKTLLAALLVFSSAAYAFFGNAERTIFRTLTINSKSIQMQNYTKRGGGNFLAELSFQIQAADSCQANYAGLVAEKDGYRVVYASEPNQRCKRVPSRKTVRHWTPVQAGTTIDLNGTKLRFVDGKNGFEMTRVGKRKTIIKAGQPLMICRSLSENPKHVVTVATGLRSGYRVKVLTTRPKRRGLPRPVPRVNEYTAVGAALASNPSSFSLSLMEGGVKAGEFTGTRHKTARKSYSSQLQRTGEAAIKLSCTWQGK